MKRFFRSLVLCLIGVGLAYPQTAVVTRNTNLRADPSTSRAPVVTLTPPEPLSLLDTRATKGFYHVHTSSGQAGWVWSKNVRVGNTFAAAAPSAIGNTISPDWEKFDPAVTTFTNADGTVCKDGGDDKDHTTYRYKDRTDTAESHHVAYHEINLAVVKALPYFANEHRNALDGFTNPDDKKEVFKYQGIPVQLDGWLADDLRNEAGEATNCGSANTADVDWHLVLAGEGEDPSKSVFVEITPRLRPSHPKWKKSDFKKGTHLRVQGWLMYDPDHKNQMTTHKRATLWEVHPVVKVWKEVSGQWIDLDQ